MGEPARPADGRCLSRSGETPPPRTHEQMVYTAYTSSDDAAVKLIYLSIRQIETKWKRLPREWQAAKPQLAKPFAEPFTLED